MQKFIACFVCILGLLTAAVPVIIAEDNQNSTGNISLNRTQNATGNITLNETQNANQHTKVLRAGFDKSRHLNNLDVFGNRSTYSIPGSNLSSAFDLGQRRGNASKFAYNTGSSKPLYDVSQYRRTKPTYEVPGTPSKPVYSISGYPVIKAPNSIP